MRRLPAYLAAVLILAAPGWAEGTVRAVLAGVSDYLYIDADLKGPRNDVRLMRDSLLARGVAPDAITVLSEDAEMPTRAAILSALDRLARDSGPGDTALFYFSGHGTQAPDLDGDEMGGMDEIFLPADARGWSGAAGRVENAISDDTFRARAGAILATGARLVAVIDACHSASGFRALGGQGVARMVPPALLGIPDDAPAGAGGAPAPLSGEFVFLYAAQSDERAFEYPVGPAEDPASWHGGFTRALAQVLMAAPDLTWAQAMQAVLSTMKQGAATQTPDAEGPMLNSAVFGSAVPPPPRVAFEGSDLKAGRLSGFESGAQLALFAEATGSEPAARAEITAATARGATFRVTGGAAPARGFAVQTAPGLPPPVRFSAPQAADGGDYAALANRLGQLAGAGRIDGVVFGAPDYDIGLVLTGGQLALTGPDGVLDPHGPGSSPRVAGDDLAAALDRAARVHRLRAALDRTGGAGAAALLQAMPGLRVEVGHRAGQPRPGGCSARPGPERGPVRDGQPIAPCDQLWLHLRNGALQARDVTVLYIDSANTVTALWPTGGLSNRLGFGEEVAVGVQVVESSAARGREELIVIGVPAEPGAPRTVLTALADPAPSRAAAATPAASYLLTAADPGQAGRGFSLLAPVDPIEVTRIAFEYRSKRMEN